MAPTDEITIDSLEMIVAGNDWEGALPYCPKCNGAKLPFTREIIRSHGHVLCPECGAKVSFRNATVLLT
jgi:hypothetical protein